MFRPLVVALALALMATAPANACRVVRSPEQRIADARAKEPGLQVALVRVTDARPRTFPPYARMKAANPQFDRVWRAVGTIERLLVGEWSPELVLFERTGSSCDDDEPTPRAGDRWIVYLSGKWDAAVLESYPLAVAERADPALRDMLPGKR